MCNHLQAQACLSPLDENGNHASHPVTASTPPQPTSPTLARMNQRFTTISLPHTSLSHSTHTARMHARPVQRRITAASRSPSRQVASLSPPRRGALDPSRKRRARILDTPARIPDLSTRDDRRAYHHLRDLRRNPALYSFTKHNPLRLPTIDPLSTFACTRTARGVRPAGAGQRCGTTSGTLRAEFPRR